MGFPPFGFTCADDFRFFGWPGLYTTEARQARADSYRTSLLTFRRISHRSISILSPRSLFSDRSTLRFRTHVRRGLETREARMKKAVRINVNGTTHDTEVEPRLLLVHYLRDALGLTGTQDRKSTRLNSSHVS